MSIFQTRLVDFGQAHRQVNLPRVETQCMVQRLHCILLPREPTGQLTLRSELLDDRQGVNSGGGRHYGGVIFVRHSLGNLTSLVISPVLQREFGTP